ncbi:hypothetical protein A2372_01755 [Candidatus Wolfebacteria bacterium RIFOXYB1_FULL_54_12]|uniref:Transcriptional repressor PaaX-like central Cas2-like domain-containing protein n=1 Tax=Candidatus Wolfebacteria bacterium RIFOXYB1_FULL_54_12 TaxID=1802559 RepID=A0A1F8DXB1_9BACT|nr:MAG: hypothetical protein A2372_01755 [Candidatus Wolfebacteria bacterium RIFOXYB1_FULL_54_12]
MKKRVDGKQRRISGASRRDKAKDLTGKILRFLLISGGIAIAMTSPYFVTKVVYPALGKLLSGDDSLSDPEKKAQLRNTFYYLQSKGFIEFEDRNGQVFIALTGEGKRMAGKYQINDLKIRKDKKWDKKWRILIFDIAEKHKIKREALRGKLRELGFYQLQKSVWVYPYDFEREAVLLREFFGLAVKEMTIIAEAKIEEDDNLRKFFDVA